MRSTRRDLGVAAAGLFFLSLAAAPALSNNLEAVGNIGRGKEVFQGKCTACHDAEKASAGQMDRAGWERTVEDMVSKGAELTAEEKAAVVDYLSAGSLLRSKCSVCHSPQRPLSRNKDLAGWRATVTRMSGKRPGHLSEEEMERIVAYLAVERPMP